MTGMAVLDLAESSDLEGLDSITTVKRLAGVCPTARVIIVGRLKDGKQILCTTVQVGLYF